MSCNPNNIESCKIGNLTNVGGNLREIVKGTQYVNNNKSKFPKNIDPFLFASTTNVYGTHKGIRSKTKVDTMDKLNQDDDDILAELKHINDGKEDSFKHLHNKYKTILGRSKPDIARRELVKDLMENSNLKKYCCMQPNENITTLKKPLFDSGEQNDIKLGIQDSDINKENKFTPDLCPPWYVSPQNIDDPDKARERYLCDDFMEVYCLNQFKHFTHTFAKDNEKKMKEGDAMSGDHLGIPYRYDKDLWQYYAPECKCYEPNTKPAGLNVGKVKNLTNAPAYFMDQCNDDEIVYKDPKSRSALKNPIPIDVKVCNQVAEKGGTNIDNAAVGGIDNRIMQTCFAPEGSKQRAAFEKKQQDIKDQIAHQEEQDRKAAALKKKQDEDKAEADRQKLIKAEEELKKKEADKKKLDDEQKKLDDDKKKADAALIDKKRKENEAIVEEQLASTPEESKDAASKKNNATKDVEDANKTVEKIDEKQNENKNKLDKLNEDINNAKAKKKAAEDSVNENKNETPFKDPSTVPPSVAKPAAPVVPAPVPPANIDDESNMTMYIGIGAAAIIGAIVIAILLYFVFKKSSSPAGIN